jgi:protein-S-isoprenylcysteine O-methyltransferase Ste14
MSTATSLALLALAWLLYALLHSALASLAAKRFVAARRPALMPAYRLAFNAVAVLGLLPVAWLYWRHPGPVLWQWSGWAAWVANGIALAAVLGVFASMRHYDGGEFLGLRQWRGRVRSVEDQEAFRLSPLHRHVRHPWYFLALVIVWTRDMHAATLVSALAITLYFVVGSRLEEHKLIAYHGERYRRYMRRVPGLLPLPWRRLSAAQARELLALPSQEQGADAGRHHHPEHDAVRPLAAGAQQPPQ